MFSKALYYPTIDISDEGWLKTAYLFWDGVRTIVPESIADRDCDSKPSAQLPWFEERREVCGNYGAAAAEPLSI